MNVDISFSTVSSSRVCIVDKVCDDRRINKYFVDLIHNENNASSKKVFSVDGSIWNTGRTKCGNVMTTNIRVGWGGGGCIEDTTYLTNITNKILLALNLS